MYILHRIPDNTRGIKKLEKKFVSNSPLGAKSS